MVDDELKQKNFYFRIRYVDDPPYFRVKLVSKDKAIIEGVEYVEDSNLSVTTKEPIGYNKGTT